MKTVKIILLFFIISNFSVAITTNNLINLHFFHNDCNECHDVKKLLNELKNEYSLQIIEYNILKKKNYLELLKFEKKYNVESYSPVSIFIGTNFMNGSGQIYENLEKYIIEQKEKQDSIFIEIDNEKTDDLLFEKFQKFTLPTVITLGLLDGINPCIFSVWLLLLGILSAYSNNTTSKLLLCTFCFAAGIFITYFIIGLGIFSIINELNHQFRQYLNWFLAVFCMSLGIINLMILTKNKSLFSIPKNWQTKLLKLIKKIKNGQLFSIFIIGISVAFLETICSGQIYLPAVKYMFVFDIQKSIILLLCYNIMFILPLFLLAILIIFGIRTINMLIWFQHRKKLLNVIGSIVLIILGCYFIIA